MPVQIARPNTSSTRIWATTLPARTHGVRPPNFQRDLYGVSADVSGLSCRYREAAMKGRILETKRNRHKSRRFGSCARRKREESQTSAVR